MDWMELLNLKDFKISSHDLGIFLHCFVASITQLIFTWLPIDIRRWKNNYLNLATYLGIQLKVAGFLFVIVPTVMRTYEIQTYAVVMLFLLVTMLSFWRITRIIPLEFSYVEYKITEVPPYPDFSEFRSEKRLNDLSTMRTTLNLKNVKAEKLNEMLLRLNTNLEKDKILLEELNKGH